MPMTVLKMTGVKMKTEYKLLLYWCISCVLLAGCFLIVISDMENTITEQQDIIQQYDLSLHDNNVMYNDGYIKGYNEGRRDAGKYHSHKINMIKLAIDNGLKIPWEDLYASY